MTSPFHGGGGPLARPHHDGSELYVSTSSPALGDEVEVRLRVPRGRDVREVHVRVVVDGEPAFVEAHPCDAPAGSVGDDAWWAASIRCHNPVTSYRFTMRLQEGVGPNWYWLNAEGLDALDVPDHCDFRLVTFTPPPAWAGDAVVYQVFPDRFARSADAPAVEEVAPEWAVPARWGESVATNPDVIGQQLYGGDLDGIREHLDHLVTLGVDVLYLTPFFPARSNHRYDAALFDHVDPLLGGDEALVRLVEEAHRRGLRVMGDITTNHTGDAHEWFVAARADRQAPERDFYLFSEKTGADDDAYVSWLGVPSLPKLDYCSSDLVARMWGTDDAVIPRWLKAPFGLDGWRVDVANMTGRYADVDVNHRVTQDLRRTLERVAPEALLVGEHAHDHALDATGRSWHGVMNYSAFTRPLWAWLSASGTSARFLGAPMFVPRRGGAEFARTVERFSALVPWRSRVFSWTLAGSHDTTRVRTLVGSADVVPAAAALLFTLPGTPMMTYGDEIGMEGAFGEDGRRPMPWDESTWDTDILTAYRDLIRARRELAPLRRGGLRWAALADDAVAYLRESGEGCVLVVVARAAGCLPVESLPAGINLEPVLTRGVSAAFESDGLHVHCATPGYAVFTWDRPAEDAA